MPDWLQATWKGVRKELRLRDRAEWWRKRSEGPEQKYGK
jgi:hypothetical protein